MSFGVHDLLWGVPLGDPPSRVWDPHPTEVPVVGLPTRVAAALFCRVSQSRPPEGWEPLSGPLTWSIEDPDGMLRRGRLTQFGAEAGDEAEPKHSAVDIRRTTEWSVPPHAAFFIPFLYPSPSASVEAHLLFWDALLLLTALDGGETMLDRLVAHGMGPLPFDERVEWRSRLHLPTDVWQILEAVLRWHDGGAPNARESRRALTVALASVSKDVEFSLEDFGQERVDVTVDSQAWEETSHTVQRDGRLRGGEDFAPTGSLREATIVRAGQISEWLSAREVVDRFPVVPSAVADRIMRQVAMAFSPQGQTMGKEDPGLVILPEVVIPEQELPTLRSLVAKSDIAALAGLYWQELPTVYRSYRQAPPKRRWFVNEASLLLPIRSGRRGPVHTREFRVRKPVLAHLELGLAGHLTSVKHRRSEWAALPGSRWYRFIHSEWGDFSVAICADLLDSAPWRSLRGQVLHLFMVGYNRDVELFDALTWVRAYENYANVVSVNHGSYGGSFIWTPKHRTNRELAKLRGSELFVLADVSLPTAELLKQQRQGLPDAISSAQKFWGADKSGPREEPSPWKAPPPGFFRRP